MTKKAQEWLDKNYPKENRKNIIELNISNNFLEGSLELEGFDKLEKFYCRKNKFTELNTNICTNLKELDCSANKLTSLDLRGCTKLQELDLSFNNLTSLSLSNDLKELKRFSCSDNFLTNLDYSLFNDDNLISLNITNNNFCKQDLSAFSRFVKLKLLWIGNDDEEKIKGDFYNKFHGSLNFLKNLTQLESLNISNTDIDKGLEYLPDDMKYIYCLSEQRPESKVKEIMDIDKIKTKGAAIIIDEDEGKHDWKKYKATYMTKNIIVIGRTGSGKSTLANVLTNTSIFKEGSYGSSETENCQVGTFEWKGINYRLIDTPGTSNTRLPRGKVLSEIEKVIKSVKELSKVLLVVDNNSFTEGEKEIFKLLESVLGNEIDKYTTIVRTNFVNFEDENSCAEDSKFLIEEITKFSISFTSCKVIHMDNPSINISESSKNAEKLINLNKQTREESRKKLLENLKEERCQIAMEENERFETIESPTEEIGKGKLKCQIL